MNCIQIILVVGYVFAMLKTLRLYSKCKDIAEQNLKEGVTYRREIILEPDKFTENGLRFRNSNKTARREGDRHILLRRLRKTSQSPAVLLEFLGQTTLPY